MFLFGSWREESSWLDVLTQPELSETYLGEVVRVTPQAAAVRVSPQTGSVRVTLQARTVREKLQVGTVREKLKSGGMRASHQTHI